MASTRKSLLGSIANRLNKLLGLEEPTTTHTANGQPVRFIEGRGTPSPIPSPTSPAPPSTSSFVSPSPAPPPTIPSYLQGASPEVAQYIVDYSKRYNVDPRFAAAVGRHESAGTFNPAIEEMGDVQGRGKGIGVFQVTPGVGNRYVDNLTPEQRLEPTSSIDAGIHTLADALALARTRFPDDPRRQLKDAYMIFNAGPNYGVAPSDNLQRYRQRAGKVLGYYDQYQ